MALFRVIVLIVIDVIVVVVMGKNWIVVSTSFLTKLFTPVQVFLLM